MQIFIFYDNINIYWDLGSNMGNKKTNELKPGMILKNDALSKTKQIIGKKNSMLTAQMILRLRFYNIEEVDIYENLIPAEIEKEIDKKKEAEETYLTKLRQSPEFKTFCTNYAQTVSQTEARINDIILKNAAINEEEFIQDSIHLFEQCDSAFTLLGMLHNMKQIDDSTFSHSVNVSVLCRLIGTWLNLSSFDLDQLTLAGLLHDIGKCKIPNKILSKPGKLTDQEYAYIKLHPQLGYEIIKDKDIDIRVKNCVLNHHERYDGTGYPNKKSGSDLSIFDNIVAVADVYDAMTSNRCYRNALCPFEVISNFEVEGINKYSPEVILPFMKKTANSYIGCDVLLNNQQIGRIIHLEDQYTRPMIQLKNHTFLNLKDEPDLYIQAII